jgi:hypothetical protein
LAKQLAGNQKLLGSFASDFAPGGAYADHASLLSTLDWLNVGQILIGVGADYGAARYGELATRGIPGQLGTTRYPVGAAQTWGNASRGIAVVGIGMTVWATADAAVDGKGYETANGVLNIGAGVYAITGPIGWAVGGAQGVIGLAQAGWTAHWNNRANESTANAAANQKANIERTSSRIDGINRQMEALGCK